MIPDFPHQSCFEPVRILQSGLEYGIKVNIAKHFPGTEFLAFTLQNIEQIRQLVQHYFFVQLLSRQRPEKINDDSPILSPSTPSIVDNLDILIAGETVLCDPKEWLNYYAARFYGEELTINDPIECFTLAREIERQKELKCGTSHVSKKRRKDLETFITHKHRHGSALFFGNALIHDNIDTWNMTRGLQGHLHPNQDIVGIIGQKVRKGIRKIRINPFGNNEGPFFATMTCSPRSWELYLNTLQQSGQETM